MRGLIFLTVVALACACEGAGTVPDTVNADIEVDARAHSLPDSGGGHSLGEASKSAATGDGTMLPGQREPLESMDLVNIHGARLDLAIDGLEEPWAFEFTGPHEIIVTEIRGRLSLVNLVNGNKTALEGLPEIATSQPQTGLLDVVLHPEFPNNRRIYFSYVEAEPQSQRLYLTAVATAIVEGNTLTELETILRAVPFTWSPSDFGGALAFDDEGHLFVTIGERSEDALAQRGTSLLGKLLRLNADGSVPSDNPFVDDPKVDDRIYALGLRNAQGLHFDAATGRLLEAEHGPRGGDEINIMQAGANYGWPVITYGENYTRAPIGQGTHQPGMEQPVFYYTPSIATSPLVLYRGNMFAEWEGDALVGALRGKHISWLDLDLTETGTVARSENPVLTELNGRVRDIEVATDGSIYILLETGGLYRLSRVKPQPPQGDLAAEARTFYDYVCSSCHDTGAFKAPVVGERAHWAQVLERPRDEVYRRVIEGYGAMPARGLCSACTDEHLRKITDQMLGNL